MSVVRFNLQACDALIEAQRATTESLHDSVARLSPLVSEAYKLLDWAPHPNYSPLDGIHAAAIGLTDDRRDLEWRVEYVRRLDGTGFNGGPLTGTVAVENMPHWTWEQAQAWYLAADIDSLWHNRDTPVSIHEAERNHRRLDELIANYIGTDDPAAIAAVRAGLHSGEPVVIAAQRAGVRMLEAAHIETITALAAERDLSFDDAEALWAQLQTNVVDLINAGYSPTDAGDAVHLADQHGLDIDAITALASTEGIGLLDAIALTARADHYAMTIPELTAFDGLADHFDAFDNATGGDSDGKVSLDDLRHVIANPTRFTSDQLAAANALLAHPGLLSRLDTGRDNNNVLNNGDRFGDDQFDDHTISLDDIESFHWKQAVNAIVGTRYDEIDTINGGPTDGHLSKADFEAYLVHHRAELTPGEVQALETVINGELYDKGWLERNKKSLAIAAAIVAGAAIAFGTGGLGSGISGALITAAVTGGAGAGTAGVTTLGINAISDESTWDDDLLANAGHGFLGGMAGGGLGVAPQAWGATSGLGRFAVGSGIASDGAAIVGMGATDFALDTIPGIDHDDLTGLHSAANTASLLFGVTGLTAAGAQGVRNVQTQRRIAETVDALPDYVIDDATSFITDGVSPARARVWLEDTVEGQAMLQAARDSHFDRMEPVQFASASPDELVAARATIKNRLVEQLGSGTTTPSSISTSESLYKLVPDGADVSDFSPYWMTRDDLDTLLTSRRDIADALGLPYVSHADEYRIWRIDPKDGEVLTVFSSEIAPTIELGGVLQTAGGTQQVLVPNRLLYGDAVIDVTEPIINRSNGGLLAPVREAAGIAASGIDLPTSPGPTIGPAESSARFDPTNLEELQDAGS